MKPVCCIDGRSMHATDLVALTTAIAGLDPGRGGIDQQATAIGDAITDAPRPR